MGIRLMIKSVYGRDLIYPACGYSALFAELLGKKTFTPEDIEIIKKLGYTIVVVKEDIKL